MEVGFGFILKKIISLALMPLSLGVFILLVALWNLHRGNLGKAKATLYLSIFWIFIISSAPFANFVITPLDKAYPRLEKVPANVEYILLLGGDRKRRTWEALRLYQQSPKLKIITSGYAMYDVVSEAEKTAIILEESGVRKEDILTQGKAKDTQEEANYLKARIGDNPFILVTAAYHMKRSMLLFQQQGLKPIAAPADFNNPAEDGALSILSWKQLEKTQVAFHEYIGLLWVWLKSKLA